MTSPRTTVNRIVLLAFAGVLVLAAGSCGGSGGGNDVIARGDTSVQITIAGSGHGAVTQNLNATVTCGSGVCTWDFTSGLTVVLTATASADSTFAGWSGDCSDTGTCTLKVDGQRNVTATFDLK
jgi:hypothetical protein